MISFTRIATIAPGKNAAAMAFARQVATYIKDTHKAQIDVGLPVGGNPSRVSWRSTHASLAELETAILALAVDQGYADLLAKGAELFLPGSLHDEIWRTI
jgi:hypothetical protein